MRGKGRWGALGSRWATAADSDSDGRAFEMGFNNGNDAALADDVRHGRTAPFLARSTAAAKETTEVLKIEPNIWRRKHG